VTGSTSATALVQNFELAGLLVVHTDQTVRITGGEVSTVVVVVTADGLDREAVGYFLDLVQQATGGGVPVLDDSITVGSQDHVLGDTRSREGSPSDHLGGHRVLHILVEKVALLASKHVENADSTVTTASSDVLVMPVKTHTESRYIHVSEHVLGRHLQVRLWVRLDCEMRGELGEVFLVLVLHLV